MTPPLSPVTSWQDEILAFHPCADARAWLRSQPDLDTAWATCERGDWMLWYLGRCDIDRRRLVLAACACARLALPHVKAGDNRPRQAIETAERWARGDASVALADVRKSAAAAADAAAAAAAAAAANAAYAAAAAADANAADAAAAAANAAYAAYAAADANAADAAAAAAARIRVRKECAAIVREHFPRVALPSTKPRAV